MKAIEILCIAGLLLFSRASTADDEYESRRSQYLDWIVETFGRLEPGMKPLDGRAWSLNQARLFLDEDTDKASRYFETVKLTFDADFMGIRLLKTWLDFRESQRLSPAAKQHLKSIIRDWPMDRKGGISRRARWPPGFTENHDLMHLTLGLFSEVLRGQPIQPQINELRRFLSWRFERGFYEWGSHRYQLHYTNPLTVLAIHAPDPHIRRAATDQLNIIFAERVVMSVGGYLGGPGMRSYDRNRGCDYLDNNRYDSFLPTMWLAFGTGEPRFDFSRSELEPAGDGYGNGRDPRLNQDEGMFLATAQLTPHPIVKELLDEVSKQPEMLYTGRRASAGHPFQNGSPAHPRSQQVVVYYNTPHVSLGSLQYLPDAGKMSVSYNSRPRFFSVMFAEKPEQVLRTRLSEESLDAGAKSYNYIADRVVQHRDWLIAAGELSASHGLKSRRSGAWDLFRVGRGLCAHIELPGPWHVFQVSDLDRYQSEEAFIAALQQPSIRDGHAHGRALNGDRIKVDLTTMAIQINGASRHSQMEMLHDSPFLKSRFGSGEITIRTNQRSVTFDNTALQVEADRLPDLSRGHARWGQSEFAENTTRVTHARAMGGRSPDHDCLLKAVSILLPGNEGGSVRLAVYAGGQLDHGPHGGRPAQLLYDFGRTPKGLTGWNTVTHPTGVFIPADTPIWLVWKSADQNVEVAYFEKHSTPSDFQSVRGRWDSKVIRLNAESPWPRVWPGTDGGTFDSAEYCCFLTLAPLKQSNRD